ncbi:MAG: hypothetical protein EA428_00650 [Spirochaetaceae bacterium]|nr:MAG: hypothetical protein EA428_00650 [Spirochaetaceae bacterium]
MFVDVTVPQFAEGATRIKLNRWLCAVGDQVAEAQEIAEATTDKIAVSIEAPAAGRLAEILIEPGEAVSVGQAIGRIETT